MQRRKPTAQLSGFNTCNSLPCQQSAQKTAHLERFSGQPHSLQQGCKIEWEANSAGLGSKRRGFARSDTPRLVRTGGSQRLELRITMYKGQTGPLDSVPA